MTDIFAGVQSIEDLEGKLKGLPEDAAKAYRTSYLQPKGGEFESLINLLRDKDYQKGMLENALGFQKEQMKEAGKYKMLFDLPERLIQAATLPEQLAAEGSRGIAASMMQAGQQIPQLVGYTPRNSYSYTPTRYFQ